MKTFDDLQFERHPFSIIPMIAGIRAIEFFPNNYGVSVVQGKLFYTDNSDEFELAVLKGTKKSWTLSYDTPITKDVMGHLSKQQVTEIMKKVQEL